MGKKSEPLWDVIVLGGGASGSLAAITAARKGARVLILEQKDKIGRKISATGNGKCNFTNEDMDLSHFRGNRELIKQVIGQFGKEDTLAFFHEIGILPKCKNGYYYPCSQTAASVVEALSMAFSELTVHVKTSAKVTGLHQDTYGFLLYTKERNTEEGYYRCRNLIIATGLLASPRLGSDGSAMNLVKGLGHRFTPVVPALCAFLAEGLDFKQAAGVRTDASVSLFIDGQPVCKDSGELQLTDYGISGIPVFQISRFASMALREKKCVTVEIDFCPLLAKDPLREELNFRIKQKDRTLQQLLNGMFPQKLIQALLKKAQLRSNLCAARMNEEQIVRLCKTLKHCIVKLTAAKGYEHAQVCAGGIKSEGIDPASLASKLVPGLYFAGEILDVDGICGGYNLQWAWSSGVVAGRSAARNTGKKTYDTD